MRTSTSLMLASTWVALAACGQEAPTIPSGGAEPRPAHAASVLIGRSPPPRPQEPILRGWPAPIPDDSAFVPIAEQSFDSLPAYGPPGQCGDSATAGGTGCWFVYDPAGNFVRDTVPDAPRSPPGVLSIRYAAGLEPGLSPGLVQGWSTPEEGFGRDYLAVRETGWIRVPTPTFEMQRTGVKFLGYVGVGQQAGDAIPTQLLFFHEAPTGGLTSSWPAANVNVIQQGFIDRKFVQNVAGGPVLTFGTWHQYEFLMVLNDLYAANGRLRFWLDGELLMDHDNVIYRTAENPGGFYGRRWDPVWGGRGGAPRTVDEHLQIDHVVIRGVPMPPSG